MGKFVVFVAYDDGTGADLAEHLKRELEARSVPTFVAKKDIPPAITVGEKWRETIDEVIRRCNTCILILSIDSLSPEVAREARLAFDRNKTDQKFPIIICHLIGVPRTDKQLLSAGIDSKDYQQVDFENQYDLARKIVPKIDEQGMPKSPITETRHEGDRPRVELGLNAPTVGSLTGDVPISWNVKFTFSNRGDRIVRISNSSITLLLDGPVNNIRPDRHGFGPNNQDDFIVKSNDPIMGMSSVGIRPKTAATNWEKDYVEAYKSGKMKVTLAIHYEDGDELFKFKEPHDLKIPIVEQSTRSRNNLFAAAECINIARDWVRSSLAPLTLKSWLDKLNEGDLNSQVVGMVYDEHSSGHEYDVRISREDGRVLEGSSVK